MIVLLITRCGCKQYLLNPPWNMQQEIRLPLTRDHSKDLLERNPEYLMPTFQEKMDRTFLWERTAMLEGESVEVYVEKP